MNKNLFNEIFAGTNVTASNHQEIYKKEFYDGCTTNKEKQKRRTFARKKLESIIDIFNSSSPAEKKDLAQKFLIYADKVYTSLSAIYSGNNEQWGKVTQKFVQDCTKLVQEKK